MSKEIAVVKVCARVLFGLVMVLVVILDTRLGAAETTAAEPLAEINGEAITAAELQRALGTKLSRLEEQIYDLKRQELDGLIAQRLLAQEAARRKISLEALLDAEVTSKAEPVTEQEIEAFYQANKARMRGDEASLRENIRAHLRDGKRAALRQRLVQSLRAQSKVQVHLQRPPVVRVAVETKGAPVRGMADAAVTLVEFSDYHCPFCKRAQATIRQILEQYPGKVRHVFRDFPVDGLHPQARQAAEAARCAWDQGKFWEYHDALFAGAPHGALDDLRRYARQVDLDAPAFEQCITARTHRAAVTQDYEEGVRLGVSGTPSFFVNGRLLTGAQPLEAFARMIEEELGGRQ